MSTPKPIEISTGQSFPGALPSHFGEEQCRTAVSTQEIASHVIGEEGQKAPDQKAPAKEGWWSWRITKRGVGALVSTGQTVLAPVGSTVVRVSKTATALATSHVAIGVMGAINPIHQSLKKKQEKIEEEVGGQASAVLSFVEHVSKKALQKLQVRQEAHPSISKLVKSQLLSSQYVNEFVQNQLADVFLHVHQSLSKLTSEQLSVIICNSCKMVKAAIGTDQVQQEESLSVSSTRSISESLVTSILSYCFPEGIASLDMGPLLPQLQGVVLIPRSS